MVHEWPVFIDEALRVQPLLLIMARRREIVPATTTLSRAVLPMVEEMRRAAWTSMSSTGCGHKAKTIGTLEAGKD